ncbi:MAG: DUF3696 domain-containing protein [Epsilonproteobacteria bacterium]|nr:DUF3696 domain-containing protein [Campylobacterota bacterium]
MNIDTVEIKNLKILKDISLSLGNLTLVTGVNSSGKSSFIQALLLLKQNQESLQKISHNKLMAKSISNVSSEGRDEIDKLMLKMINDSKNIPINLNGEYVQLGDKKDIFTQTVYEEDISIKLIINDINYQVVIGYEKLIISIESDFPSEAITNLFADDFQYINTDRIQPHMTYGLSDVQIRKNLIGLKGEYTAHYLDEYRHKPLDIKELKHPNSKTEYLLENVSLWLNEISNGIEVLAKKYPEIQKVGLTYQYTYGEDTTNEYNPTNVGFGITYVLPIIVAILKSKPGDLLIIENPESHLHPAGQSKIAQLCAIAASCGVQIIIETHSDHFLNGIRVATKKEVIKPEESKIYFFEKDDAIMSTKIHQLNIDQDGNINEKWPKGFFDEYRNLLDELLW